jgi:hypothetical protein
MGITKYEVTYRSGNERNSDEANESINAIVHGANALIARQ